MYSVNFKVERKKSTSSPAQSKESTSSSPETISNLKDNKSTSSPAKSKESISSSPETNKCTASTSNLNEKRVLRHLQNQK